MSSSGGASLNLETFGSPFADMNNPLEANDVYSSNYASINQPSIVQISQTELDSYSQIRDMKVAMVAHDKATDELPELIKQSERQVDKKIRSKMVNSILNMWV